MFDYDFETVEKIRNIIAPSLVSNLNIKTTRWSFWFMFCSSLSEIVNWLWFSIVYFLTEKGLFFRHWDISCTLVTWCFNLRLNPVQYNFITLLLLHCPPYLQECQLLAIPSSSPDTNILSVTEPTGKIVITLLWQYNNSQPVFVSCQTCDAEATFAHGEVNCFSEKFLKISSWVES